jgi:hypothetical protein
MIHHTVYFKLKPSVTPEALENILIETRINLLKIPEVMNLKTGKNVNPQSEWQFFLSFDCESLAKLEVYRTHPIHIKFVQEVIQPNTISRWAEDFEMEPGKNVRYS